MLCIVFLAENIFFESQTNKHKTYSRIKSFCRRAAKLGLLEQRTSLFVAMECLSLRPANFSSNRNMALHARSLGPRWDTISNLNVASAQEWDFTAQMLWWFCAVAHLGGNTAVVYAYGNFAILIQSETFSSTPYPIHIRKYEIMDSDIQIRNRSINFTLSNIIGIVYFASRGKNCGYFASCQTKVVEVATWQVGYDTQKTRAKVWDWGKC